MKQFVVMNSFLMGGYAVYDVWNERYMTNIMSRKNALIKAKQLNNKKKKKKKK